MISMRLRFVKTLLVLALLGNIIVWHRIWRLFTVQNTTQISTTSTMASNIPQKLHHHLARLVTVVILCDELPYPPLELDFANESMRNVKLINLQLGFNKSFEERNPLFYVRTKFVLFMPDATRLSTKQVMQNTITQATKLGAVTVPIGKNHLSCLNMKLKVKEWSLRFTNSKGMECDAVAGKHVTVVEAKTLRKLSDPFLLPFTDALYIQTTALGTKIYIMKNYQFNEGKPLYRSHQAQWKVQQLHQSRERMMFEKFGIKKVTRASGSVEWYGCSRETARCFGSVVNGVPSYLYQNRYTPPCCLAGLRKVAHHVFDKLEEAGIRFWLEGNSLLGAMRNNDILPWGHEVDIGNGGRIFQGSVF